MLSRDAALLMYYFVEIQLEFPGRAGLVSARAEAWLEEIWLGKNVLLGLKENMFGSGHSIFSLFCFFGA